MDVRDRNTRRLLGGEHHPRERRELLRAQLEQHVGAHPREPLLQRHGPGVPAPLRGQPIAHVGGDLLVGPVLQQPGEQQVARLQQGQVRLVLHVPAWKQPRRLQVQQGRRHQQEVAGLVQIPVVTVRPDVRDELVGDLRQGDLGDVELVLRDQREEQVEGALEVVQVHLEGVLVDLVHAPGGRRDPLRVSRHGGPTSSHSWNKGVTDSEPLVTGRARTAPGERPIRVRGPFSPRSTGVPACCPRRSPRSRRAGRPPPPGPDAPGRPTARARPATTTGPAPGPAAPHRRCRR